MIRLIGEDLFSINHESVNFYSKDSLKNYYLRRVKAQREKDNLITREKNSNIRKNYFTIFTASLGGIYVTADVIVNIFIGHGIIKFLSDLF